MSKAFWVIALGWMAGVIVSARSALKGTDGEGPGLIIPGIPPLASEVIVTTLIAVVPPLLAAMVIQARRRNREK
jgi:hypothetical protein